MECGPWRASYVGSQRSTRNGQGDEVYGGSDLTVVRGGADALDGLEVDSVFGGGITLARSYHAAVAASYPGFFASRCNYDVIHGFDQAGAARTGVLEQSWRIGGASPAEIAAMTAFASDASLALVHASSHEVYGAFQPPSNADVHYQGIDPRCGPMTKYSVLARHGH